MVWYVGSTDETQEAEWQSTSGGALGITAVSYRYIRYVGNTKEYLQSDQSTFATADNAFVGVAQDAPTNNRWRHGPLTTIPASAQFHNVEWEATPNVSDLVPLGERHGVLPPSIVVGSGLTSGFIMVDQVPDSRIAADGRPRVYFTLQTLKHSAGSFIYADGDAVPACRVYKHATAGPIQLYESPTLAKRTGSTGVYDGSFHPTAQEVVGGGIASFRTASSAMGSGGDDDELDFVRIPLDIYTIVTDVLVGGNLKLVTETVVVIPFDLSTHVHLGVFDGSPPIGDRGMAD